MFSTCRRLPAPLLVQPRLPHRLQYFLERSKPTSPTPLTASISKVPLDIDALPSPPFSSAIVTTEPLVCASPLTERALCSQRRDALRSTCDVAVASPPDTIRSNAILDESEIVPARIKKKSCSTLPFTPPTACSHIRISYSCDRPSSDYARR